MSWFPSSERFILLLYIGFTFHYCHQKSISKHFFIHAYGDFTWLSYRNDCFPWVNLLASDFAESFIKTCRLAGVTRFLGKSKSVSLLNGLLSVSPASLSSCSDKEDHHIVPKPHPHPCSICGNWLWYLSLSALSTMKHAVKLIMVNISLVPRPRPKIGERAWSHLQKFPYVLCQQSSFGVEESRSSIAN